MQNLVRRGGSSTLGVGLESKVPFPLVPTQVDSPWIYVTRLTSTCFSLQPSSTLFVCLLSLQ